MKNYNGYMAKLSDKARKKKSEYNIVYNQEHTRRFVLNANRNTEKKIIEKLESVPNKQRYIFDLIHKDISAVQKKGEIINMNDKLFKFICENYSEHYRKYLEYNDKFHDFKANGEPMKAKESANAREYHRDKMENIEDVMNDYFITLHLEYKKAHPSTGRVRCRFNVGEFKLLNFIDEDGNIKVEELWNFVQIG